MSVWTLMAGAALALTSDASASFEAIIANAKGQAEDQFFELSEVPALPESVVFVPLKDATLPWPEPLSAGSYRYEGGRLLLSYSASQGSNAGIRQGKPLKHWNEIAVWSVVKSVGSLVGTNAYGVSAPIEVFERHTIKFRFDEGGEHPAGIFQRAELELGPQEARALALEAALEIKLENPSDVTRQAECQTAVRPARLGRPIEVHDTTCTISVGVTSIKLVRRNNGEEIPTGSL